MSFAAHINAHHKHLLFFFLFLFSVRHLTELFFNKTFLQELLHLIQVCCLVCLSHDLSPDKPALLVFLHTTDQKFLYKPDAFTLWRATVFLASAISFLDVPNLMTGSTGKAFITALAI